MGLGEPPLPVAHPPPRLSRTLHDSAGSAGFSSRDSREFYGCLGSRFLSLLFKLGAPLSHSAHPVFIFSKLFVFVYGCFFGGDVECVMCLGMSCWVCVCARDFLVCGFVSVSVCVGVFHVLSATSPFP